MRDRDLDSRPQEVLSIIAELMHREVQFSGWHVVLLNQDMTQKSFWSGLDVMARI